MLYLLTFPVLFIFAVSVFFLIILPEVYLFISLFKEPAFGLVEPFILCLSSSLALYLFTSVCVRLFYLCTLKMV